MNGKQAKAARAMARLSTVTRHGVNLGPKSRARYFKRYLRSLAWFTRGDIRSQLKAAGEIR